MKLALILLAECAWAFAQDHIVVQTGPQESPELARSPSKKLDLAPAISAELRAEFWRANAEWLAAQASADKAKAKLDASQAKMSVLCGPAYQLAGDPQTGEPACVEKPKPVETKK